MRRALLCMVLMFIWVSASAGQERVRLGDAAAHALQQSQIIVEGGRPFHLRATISEKDQPDSDYQARIEEYWVSPTKWRRTVESPDFSQTIVVNGTSVWEKDDGDYFPVWLGHLLTALLDPLPMLDALKKVDSEIPKPRGGEGATVCGDIHARVDRWVICFEGSHGLLASVFTKGYAAEFKDYKKFNDKRVAYRITTDPEPGTALEEKILELSEYSQPDEAMFKIAEDTLVADRIKTVRISEDTFREMALTSTEIDWPAVGGGPETGGCAVYVSADRKGQVREAWPAGCDNAGLQDPLREAVKKWRLKPAQSQGTPVQVEALLGFTFHAAVYQVAGPPQLSNEEARALGTKIVEPNFSQTNIQKGAQLSVEISVDENGKLTGVRNIENLGKEFGAIYLALTKWQFRPYVKDGKAQYFHARVIFRVQ